jgi:cytochrome P450
MMIDSAFLDDLYAACSPLHARGALHCSEEFCSGAWLVLNYVDVVSVLRDPRFPTQRAGRRINGRGSAARADLREFK